MIIMWPVRYRMYFFSVAGCYFSVWGKKQSFDHWQWFRISKAKPKQRSTRTLDLSLSCFPHASHSISHSLYLASRFFSISSRLMAVITLVMLLSNSSLSSLCCVWLWQNVSDRCHDWYHPAACVSAGWSHPSFPLFSVYSTHTTLNPLR